MKASLKENWILLVAFALPIVLIAGVALSTYLPAFLVETEHNFIYATCDGIDRHYMYDCKSYLTQKYDVVDNQLTVNEVEKMTDTDGDRIPDTAIEYSTRLFLHDTRTNESREITLEEAQSYSLSSLLTSPDGVTFSDGYERGTEFFPFFGGNSSYQFYLTQGSKKSRLNLIYDDGYYYGRDYISFIGWIQ